MQWLWIVVVSMLACVSYGIIHDQFTVRISLEYFTIGHDDLFATRNPTLLAVGWGVVASWWVGLLLGIPLAASARLGQRPKKSAVSLVRPIGVLMACTACLAALMGVVALVAAWQGRIDLTGPMAERIPEHRRLPFLIDLWIHNTSYVCGFVGGLCLIAWVWWNRIVMARDLSGDELNKQSVG